MVRTNLSLFDNFNQLTPYAVGFDRVFDQLQNYVENNATSDKKGRHIFWKNRKSLVGSMDVFPFC